MGDLVGAWKVQLSDGKKYKIEFEHGTTTGRRVVRINSDTIFKKDWMFKLVGPQEFRINKSTVGRIEITPNSTFSYEYELFINNKSYSKFKKERSKTAQNWIFNDVRITLEKSTMEVFLNGEEVETEGLFGDMGVETHFCLLVGSKKSKSDMFQDIDNEMIGVNPEKNREFSCVIRNVSSGNKREGMMHLLFVNDIQIPEL